jgi:AmmeMemoRadiSam system protein B
MKVRKATFAGSWYPDSATACRKEILAFQKEIEIPAQLKRRLIGGIVPHAGWYFSGSIACNVIASLQEAAAVDVIVLFGMHLHSSSPNYIMLEGAWETPLGVLPIATDLAEELARRFSFQVETVRDYNRDNTIELQLPFIKYFFDDVAIVPVGVPPSLDSLEIGRAVADISHRMGLKTKVIGSTDLTHYGINYGFAPKGTGPSAIAWAKEENDRRIMDAMLNMDAEEVIREALKSQNACCAGAAATAIEAGKSLGADRADFLAYTTSYDKSPGDSFVGYAGIVF